MLFVYGTLQDRDILGAVLGRIVDPVRLRPATAPGFRAVTYPGRVYPALAPHPGDAAPGLVIDGLDQLDFRVLDAFEGAEYRRARITVQVDGVQCPADAYLPVTAIDGTAATWSLHEWTTRHKPAVVADETATGTVLRQRLSARAPH